MFQSKGLFGRGMVPASSATEAPSSGAAGLWSPAHRASASPAAPGNGQNSSPQPSSSPRSTNAPLARRSSMPHTDHQNLRRMPSSTSNHSPLRNPALPVAAADPDDLSLIILRLKSECAALHDEILVKSEVARSVGLYAIATRNELESTKELIKARESDIQRLKRMVSAAEQQSGSSTELLQSRIRQLEAELKNGDSGQKSIQVEVEELRQYRTTAEAQMADWRAKVKEALKESKRKEQELTTTEIQLRAELQQAQQKVHEVSFELQRTVMVSNKIRVAKETQTDASLSGVTVPLPLTLGNSFSEGGLAGSLLVTSATIAGSPTFPLHHNSASPLDTTGSLRRRRRSTLAGAWQEHKAGSPSLAINPEYLAAGSPFSNPPPPGGSSLTINTAFSSSQAPLIPLNADDGSTHNNSTTQYQHPQHYHAASSPFTLNQSQQRFPLPLSPAARPPPSSSSELLPQQQSSPLKSPPNPFTDAPEPPPFIVTVSYATAEGWSIDSKHRIVSGTTVFSLIEQCTHQFEARHALVLRPDAMCLRVNHETARRSVILASDRVLHSFSFFQKMQRENSPIVLYLTARDHLRDAVQQRLKQVDQQQQQQQAAMTGEM